MEKVGGHSSETGSVTKTMGKNRTPDFVDKEGSATTCRICGITQVVRGNDDGKFQEAKSVYLG